MNRKNCISALPGALAFIAAPAVGQNNANVPGVPYDWSHNHAIYSPPGTQDPQTNVTADPRYWHQWTYRNLRHGLPSITSEQPLELSPSILNILTPKGLTWNCSSGNREAHAKGPETRTSGQEVERRDVRRSLARF